MRRYFIIQILLLLYGCSVYGQFKKEFEGAFYYGDLPYWDSYSHIRSFCISNGFDSIKNSNDSSLFDYRITHYKGPSFAVDITEHTIEVNWLINDQIDSLFFKRALVFSRIYYYNKLFKEYPQEKYDSQLDEHYNHYVNSFSKRFKVIRSGINCVENSTYTIFKLRTYKKSKYFLEIVRKKDTIINKLIREIPE